MSTTTLTKRDTRENVGDSDAVATHVEAPIDEVWISTLMGAMGMTRERALEVTRNSAAAASPGAWAYELILTDVERDPRRCTLEEYFNEYARSGQDDLDYSKWCWFNRPDSEVAHMPHCTSDSFGNVHDTVACDKKWDAFWNEKTLEKETHVTTVVITTKETSRDHAA
jgi:hypothetical protein